jgi:hypothetical protein
MIEEMTSDSSRELLERFKPLLLYDSQEAFFADSAAEMTENPGNTLCRAPHDGVSGRVIAAANGADPGRRLSLELLGRPSYGDSEPVRSDDRLSIAGRNYRAQYVRLRKSHPELRNRIYGRATRDRDDRLWLQYWFWYFYNDYHLAADFGLHEGDWEMIQLRIDGDAPDVAVYAQHGAAEKRPWPAVKHPPDRPDTPLVFPGRGSHASYFEPGVYETEAWFDIADGRRAPRNAELSLDVIESDSEPGWVAWPGRWGDTEPNIPGIEQPSPHGPCGHGQWNDPELLLDTAVTRDAQPLTSAPQAPRVKATRRRGMMRLDYDFTGRAGPEPEKLVVTVNSRDEPDVPPRTFTFGVQRIRSGRLDTRIALERGHHYDINASVISAGDRTAVPSAAAELHPVGELRLDAWVDRLKHAGWSASRRLERLQPGRRPPGP